MSTLLHHTAPAWFTAQRAMVSPIVKPVQSQRGIVKQLTLISTSEIESFEFESPVNESHTDDCFEGLDTFDFSLSID